MLVFECPVQVSFLSLHSKFGFKHISTLLIISNKTSSCSRSDRIYRHFFSFSMIGYKLSAHFNERGAFLFSVSYNIDVI